MSSLAQRTNVRDRAHARGTVMAALDIGSSKVTCMISRRGDATDGEPRVAGAGAQGTKGVRSGAVVDLDNLERSIRLAVEQAERAADLRITDVVLGVSGPDLRSDVVRAKLPATAKVTWLAPPAPGQSALGEVRKGTVQSRKSAVRVRVLCTSKARK